MNEEEIKELISRRRRQILVHSVIYYKMNNNLISDSKWAEWALELEELQKKYPNLAKQCPYADVFKGFDHSTGMSLPLEDPWAVGTASYLLKIKNKNEGIYNE